MSQKKTIKEKLDDTAQELKTELDALRNSVQDLVNDFESRTGVRPIISYRSGCDSVPDKVEAKIKMDYIR